MKQAYLQREINKADLEVYLAGRRRFLFLLLSVFLVILFFLDIFLGSVEISPADVFNSLFHRTGGNVETIILQFRIPKALTALAVGIALSLSGLQMQTVFRNPMAGSPQFP